MCLAVMMRQPSVVGMPLCGMRGCHGQRADCDRASNEEENFVHYDPQPDAQSQQHRHP
jgi:hypothetical protein